MFSPIIGIFNTTLIYKGSYLVMHLFTLQEHKIYAQEIMFVTGNHASIIKILLLYTFYNYPKKKCWAETIGVVTDSWESGINLQCSKHTELKSENPDNI